MTIRELYLKDVDLDRTISPNCSVSSLGYSNFHEKGVTDIRLFSKKKFKNLKYSIRNL